MGTWLQILSLPPMRCLQQLPPVAAITVAAPASSFTCPSTSWSCRPLLERSLFPGMVTRSSCVWLQTEREREPAACVFVPVVAQATWGQPGAAKWASGQGRAALWWPGVAHRGSHCSQRKGSGCSVPLNTTRPGTSVWTEFYCRPGLQHGSAASFGLRFTKAAGGHRGSGQGPWPVARQCQALLGHMPGPGASQQHWQ